jgi:hypothetical protein
VSGEWVHVRCGKPHPIEDECPALVADRDPVEVATARLAGVVEVRDRLHASLEANEKVDAAKVLLDLDKALERETLSGPRTEVLAIEPDEQGFVTVHHHLDSENVSAVAMTADGEHCVVLACTPFGVDEVEVLTAPEARSIRLVTRA